MRALLECGKHAIPFIERYFLDCVYTNRDLVGFCFGMTSIVVWVIAQVPQFVSNIKNQSAEALSAWFLANWLLGDTCNLLGCLLQGEQLPTTTYTAMYFILADAVMMIQYIYFHALQRRKERLAHLRARHQQHHHRRKHRQGRPATDLAVQAPEHTTLTLEADPPAQLPPTTTTRTLITQTVATTTAALLLVTFMAYHSTSSPVPPTPSSLHPSHPPHDFTRGLSYAPANAYPPFHDPHHPHHLKPSSHWWSGGQDWQFAAGTALGWVSSALYLMSRVSQIFKNHQRQSSEGLSLAMFGCAVTANLCTGTSILLRAASLSDMLLTQGPWILGSLGVISMDVIIFSQAVRFGALRKAVAAEAEHAALQAPLLAHRSE